MKKNSFWALMLAALAVLSCEKTAVMEVPVPEVQEEPDPWTIVPITPRTALGGVTRVTAGYGPDTRSHLEMGPAGTRASVVWSAGDTFDAYSFETFEYSPWYGSFVTEEGGENAAFSTQSGLGDPTDLYCVYPSVVGTRKISIYTENDQTFPIFEVQIPTEQAAVAGSVAEGLNVALFHAKDIPDHFSFSNLPSLVKFKMTGSVVSQVKSVTFKGTSALAGTYIVYVDEDEKPAIIPSLQFDGSEGTSSTVTLSGDFVAGEDYYFALAPCQQVGFQMVFANEDGSETTTLTSTMDLVFERSAIRSFGTIDLGDAFTDTHTVNMDPVHYLSASAGAPKSVSIAVVPDGFTEEEMDDYEMSARMGLDALFATEPYKTYKQYFSVWILKVASNESGASVTDGKGHVITYRDTYFGSRWGESSYGDMEAADENKVYNFVTNNCPDIKDGSHSINDVPILMLINDSRYGGIAHCWSNGKVYCQVPLTGRNLAWGYPGQQAKDKRASQSGSNIVSTSSEEYAEMGQNIGDWRNTLVHEFGGHSIGRLGDEYWYSSSDDPVTSMSTHSWSVPFDLNISASYSSTPWDDLLKSNHGSLDGGEVRDDLVARDPNYARIGVFQGADVSMFNRWRSEKVSCMIDNRFYFSTVQRYLIVERIMKMSGVLSSWSYWGPTPRLSWDDFFENDVTTDPVRDVVNAPVMGVSDIVPPRPVPLLPPPVLHEN